MARWKQGQKVTKSDWEWQKLYNNYEHHYERLNRSEEGFHLLGDKYSKEEFKKVYRSAKWKQKDQIKKNESNVIKEKVIRVNALEIARSQRRSNYLTKIKVGDKEEVRGQIRMISKLKKLEKGLKKNDPQAIAEYNFIINNPGLQDAFETYTGTTLFNQNNTRGNNYFKKTKNINQASFADNLDSYLDSLGLQHTQDNYTKAREVFESAMY